MNTDTKDYLARLRPAPAKKLKAALREAKAVGPRESPVQVRAAGPEAMRDKGQPWSDVDQVIDESFPASDPPTANRFD